MQKDLRSYLTVMEADEEIACPVAMGNPDPQVVERVMRRERASRRKAKDNGRLCFLLGKELPSSRLANRQWCSCGSCVTFTTIRENVCCREALEEGRGNEALKGLREKLKECGQCIVHHPSFYKVAQDPEVTFQFFRYIACLRYCAYRAFVAWCYGHLGFSKRYELPACVRGAIMRVFPSRSGVYVGFKVMFTCPPHRGLQHF
ncbi:hypothetical protein COOONC_02462 [Cooperia oncophora]